jgi:hypothetical protein
MRASHLRSNLEEINRMPEPARSGIRDKISPDVLEQVANSVSVAWLPVECDVDITRAVVDVLGVEGNRRWSRDALLRSANGPLLKPILDGASALFGLTPHALYKVAPRGFGMIYRNIGEVRYEVVGELRARIVHEEILPSLLEVPWYLEGIAGAFEAGYVFLGLEGEVHLELDVAQRTAHYDIHWLAKGAMVERP